MTSLKQLGEVTSHVYTNRLFYDSNTGLYQNSPNTLALVTAGVERIRLDSNGNTNIIGNLIVTGCNIVANVQTVTVRDNIIALNDGEVGNGVTAGQAGLSVNRGTQPEFQILFDESIDMFRMGQIGQLETIASHPWVGQNSLWKACNLSDIPVALNARSNLGLGLSNTVSFANVGVNILTPSERLHVGSGKIRADSQFLSGGDGGGVTTPAYSFAADSNTGLYNPSSDTLAVVTGGVERMRVDSVGNVGIGTNAPTSKLQVIGAMGLHVSGTLTDNRIGVQIGDYSIQRPAIKLVGNTDATIDFVSSSSDFRGRINYSQLNDTMYFNTGGVTNARLVIDNEGRVGINMTSPREMLDIVGNIRASQQFLSLLTLVGTPAYSFATDSNTGLYNPSSDTLGLVTGGVERMRVDSVGNIGIGTAATSLYRLNVAGDLNFSGALTQGGSPFQTSRWTSNAFGIFINSNVGIGTAATSLYMLNVAGDLNFSGALTQGGAPFQTSRWTIISAGAAGAGAAAGVYVMSNVGIGTSNLAGGAGAGPGLTLAGSLFSAGHKKSDIGTSNVMFKNIYSDRVYVGNSNVFITGNDSSVILSGPIETSNLLISGALALRGIEIIKGDGTLANVSSFIAMPGYAYSSNNIISGDSNGRVITVSTSMANRVGINTSLPLYTLDVAGDLNFSGALTQGGAPFQTSRWTANSLGIHVMSNVGIGTSNLAGAGLTLAGSLFMSGGSGASNLSIGTSNNRIVVRGALETSNLVIPGGITMRGLEIVMNTPANASANILTTGAVGGGGGQWISGVSNASIYYMSNVGIGTSNLVAGAALTVNGNIVPAANMMYNLGSFSSHYNDAYLNSLYINESKFVTSDGDWFYIGTNSVSIDMRTTGTAITKITSANEINLASSGLNAKIGLNTIGVGSMMTLNSPTMIFTTNTSETLRIDVNGRVGINNNNPSYRLDVTGNVRITSNLDVGLDGTPGIIRLGGPAGDTAFDHAVIATRLYNGTDNSELIIFKGNDAYQDRIRLRAPNIAFDTYVTNTTDYNANNIRMYINGSGYVGINNTSPGYHLDVNGDINLSGTLRKYGQEIVFNDTTWNKDLELNNINTTFNVGMYNLDVNSNARIANINAQTIQLIKPAVETFNRIHPDSSLIYTFESSEDSYNAQDIFDNNLWSVWQTQPVYQLYNTNSNQQFYIGSSTTSLNDDTYYGAWLQINFPVSFVPISFTIKFSEAHTYSNPYTLHILGRNGNEENPWIKISDDLIDISDSTVIPSTYNNEITSIRIVVSTIRGYNFDWEGYWGWQGPPLARTELSKITIIARETRIVSSINAQGLLHVHGGDMYISKQTSSNSIGGEHGAIVFASAARNMLSDNSAKIVSGYNNGAFDNTGYLSFWTSANNSNALERMRVASDGKVAIGNSNPAHELDVTGTIRATGDVLAFSDCNYKYDVNRINNALESVKVLNGYTYRLKEASGASRHAGVFAQEVEQVLPEVVHTDIDGKKSVAYGNMTGLLIEAIKELSRRVESMESLQKSFIK